MKKYLVIKEYIKLPNWKPDVFESSDVYEDADNLAKAMNKVDPSHKYWVYQQSY